MNCETLYLLRFLGNVLGASWLPAEIRELADKNYDLLDDLIDEVGEDENHPLASMMEILGVLIEHYEMNHVPELTSD